MRIRALISSTLIKPVMAVHSCNVSVGVAETGRPQCCADLSGQANGKLQGQQETYQTGKQ